MTQLQVLLIDDEQSFLDLMTHALKRANVQVIGAVTNPEDGMSLAMTHFPDAIVVDVRLPRINGYTLVSQLRTRPELRSAVIIMVSAADNGDFAANAGADGFLQKPFVTGDLVNLILRQTAEKRASA